MTPEEIWMIASEHRPEYQVAASVEAFAAAIETATIERCVLACAQSQTVSHACDAIRALAKEGS